MSSLHMSYIVGYVFVLWYKISYKDLYDTLCRGGPSCLHKRPKGLPFLKNETKFLSPLKGKWKLAHILAPHFWVIRPYWKKSTFKPRKPKIESGVIVILFSFSFSFVFILISLDVDSKNNIPNNWLIITLSSFNLKV